MKKFKRLVLTLIATLICVFSTMMFTGCDDDDTCKLYVFAGVGGCVQVDNNEELVKFGDEGSKYFTYKEDSKVKLKAIANKGYQFVKWMYTDDLDDESNIDPNKAEIEFVIDDDKVVIRAQFAVDGSITYNVNYPTSTTGYDISIESGYTANVILGGDFKFKVNLWQDYSNSNIVVKANGSVITSDSNDVYTIPNINTDIEITIDGVEQNPPAVTQTFTISENDNRFTIVPISTNGYQVNNGDSFVFKIELASGWVFGANVVVKANGVALNNPIDDKYTIYSIGENILITVEGIEQYVAPQMYDITFSGAGFTIVPQNNSSFQVVSGESFEFKIQLNSGYQFGTNVIVKANGIALQAPINDVYKIYSVVDNIEITVEGIEVEKISYQLTLTFKDKDLANMAEDIWLTIPHSISFEIAENASNLEGASALSFEFNRNVSGQQITVEQLFNNINEFIADHPLLNKTEVSHLEINGNMFIGKVNGVMTIDWSVLDTAQVVDIVLI